MKTTGCQSLLSVILLFSLHAQAQLATDSLRAPTETNQLTDAKLAGRTGQWRVKQRAAHETEWYSVRYRTNAGTGKVTATTNSYIELATGLNRFEAGTGKWVESKEEIEIVPGGAIARKGQHQVSFAANINIAGAIQTTAPDGKVLRSHVLGLAYTDAATGESVLIAQPRDSIGEVIENQVIYRDAFDGQFRADLRYTYTKAGFEQDVIFRESPPAPEKFGLNSETARLEVWTEFLSPPAPVKTVSLLKLETNNLVRSVMVDPDMTDELLDFGAMRIGTGTAFSIENAASPLDKPAVPVGKDWLRLEGRDFLIEKIDFEDAQPLLQELPAARVDGVKQASFPARRRTAVLASLKGPTMDQDRAQATAKPMRTAAVAPAERGFVLDYLVNLAGNPANMVFKSDTTYYVSGVVNLTGTTTIEGGTVVKYASGTTAYINVQGPLICQTEPYRPAFFTARDDNSVGEIISGSTGVPSGYYGQYSLRLTSGTLTYSLRHLRVRHGYYGIYRFLGSASAPTTIEHSQIQNCYRAVTATSSPLFMRNLLIYRCESGVFSSTSLAAVGENITFHRLGALQSSASLPALKLTNSLIISCTNYLNYAAESSVHYHLDDAGIFQSSGTAEHYLAAASSYRAVGKVTGNSTFLASLTNTTTHRPLILSGTVGESLVLAPSIVRNSKTAPDIGYAYDAVDFLAQNLVVQGSLVPAITLTLTNGVVVAVDPQAGQAGISFGNYSELVSVGQPGLLNRILPVQMVYEGGSTAANWPSFFRMLHGFGLGIYPNAYLRFTDISMPSGPYYVMGYWNGGFIKLTFQDSQVRGGTMYLGSDNQSQSIALMNTCWDRVSFTHHPYAPGAFNVRNNLFKGGALYLDMNPAGAPVWTFHDNLFDGTLISQTGGPAVENNYNAYVHTAQNSTRLSPSPGTGDVILTASPQFEAGPFGSNYLPATATQLIDKGSFADAKDAGLFHYTSRAVPETREGNTRVDIGLHYVGTDLEKRAKDTDGDGYADYYEDRNGNGRHEMTLGERRWQGVPTEPIIKFSATPLEYYPNAGLLTLDASVTVTDNSADDENFVNFLKIIVETGAGDIVRFLPDSELVFNNSGTITFTPAPPLKPVTITIAGGDAITPFVATFSAHQSPGSVQALLRKLKYVTERMPEADSDQRSVRVTLEDNLGARTTASRQVRLFSDRPALTVDAGPDISLTLGGPPIPFPSAIQGKVKSTVKSEHVSLEWTLVEPVFWKYEEVPNTPDHPGPFTSIHSVCSAQPYGDILGQRNGNQPRLTASLDAGQEVTLSLAPALPLPTDNRHCWWLPEYQVQAWRYRFRLTATDGNRTVTDEVVVRIFPPVSAGSNPHSEIPEVSIRPTRSIKAQEALALSSDVLNEPDETLTYLWKIEALDGTMSDTATGDPNHPTWTYVSGSYTTQARTPNLKLNQTGTYLACLSVTDSRGREGSDKISIIVCTEPVAPTDIMFVVDYSGSLGGPMLFDAESAVLSMLNGVAPGLHRAGLVAFSQQAQLRVPLTMDARALVPAVRYLAENADYDYANSIYTLTHPALRLAAEHLRVEGRPNVEKVIVLVTDAVVPSFDIEQSTTLAGRLREQGFRIVTILPRATYWTAELLSWDIGDAQGLFEDLTSISNPFSQYLINLPAMVELKNLIGNPLPQAAELREKLLLCLNRVIRGASLATALPEHGPNITLSRHTIALRDSEPVGYDLMRLNRMILSDASTVQGYYKILPAYEFMGPQADFMSGVATTPGDAYVARSSGLAAIPGRLAASVCADKPSLLTVELGNEQTILIGQQAVIRARVGDPEGPDFGQITSHAWRQHRFDLASSPAGPQGGPPGNPLLGATMTIEGDNDPEITIHSFPSAGEYQIQVEVRTSTGAVGLGTTTIRVVTPPPPGESYEDVEYITAVVGYWYNSCAPDSPESGSSSGSGSLPFGGCVTVDGAKGGVTAYFGFSIESRRTSDGLMHYEQLGSLNPWWDTRTFDPTSGTYVHCFKLPHELTNGVNSLVLGALSGGHVWKDPRFGLGGLEKFTGGYDDHIIPGFWMSSGVGSLGDLFIPVLPKYTDSCTTLCDAEISDWRSLFPGGGATWGEELRRMVRATQTYNPQNFLDGIVFEQMISWLAGSPTNLAIFTATFPKPVRGAPWNIEAGNKMTVARVGGVAEVHLDGNVRHKRSPGTPFNATWTLISGPPGGATYNNATFTSVPALTTTALLSQPGTYLFKLTVSEQAPAGCSGTGNPILTAEDYLTVNVDNAEIYAGPDQLIDLDESVASAINVAMQGARSSIVGHTTWITLSHPPAKVPIIYNPSSATYPASTNTLVQLPGVGTYKFRLSADSGVASDIVTIHVNGPPKLGTEGVGGNPGQPPIVSLDAELTSDGFVLSANAHDDDQLPPGSTLRYSWEWIPPQPADGISCTLDSPHGPATRVRFVSYPNDEQTRSLTFKVTVSDGRLSTSETVTFSVKPAAMPELSFQVFTNQAGVALELFPRGSELAEKYLRATDLVSFNTEVFDNGVWSQMGVSSGATLEGSGTVLRFSPVFDLPPCGRTKETFEATFVDRYGGARTGKVYVYTVPPLESKAQYERNHVFKYMALAGDTLVPQIILPLRDMLIRCPEDLELPIAGLTLPPAIAQPMETPLGTFQVLPNPSEGNKEYLYYTPKSTHDGAPIKTTLTFQLHGAPGVARFEFLLLPSTSMATDEEIGGIDDSSTVELDEEFVLTTYQTIEGSGAYFEYWDVTWEVNRLDGPDPTVPIVPISYGVFAPSGNPDTSKATFKFDSPIHFPGIYAISAYIDGNLAGVSRVVVLPVGSLRPSREAEPVGDFDLAEEEGPNPDEAPGRASILNLPLPTTKPLEITDGFLRLKAQAAGPTVDNQCSFKVLLFPADAGNEVADLSDESRAQNITTLFGLSVGTSGQYQGWHAGCRGEADGSNVDFAAADLSSFTNGNYFVQVWARGVKSAEAGGGPGIVGKSFKHPILLNTARKPGKVQFSETDFDLAAADGRLRISRNYNSEMGPPSGSSQIPPPELGWGWSLSSFDLGVQLYEYRAFMEEDSYSFWGDDEQEALTPRQFDIRVKGSRHVSLNLPWSGRRVSFAQGTGRDGLPYWETPEGESGRLIALDEERRAYAACEPNEHAKTTYYLSQFGRFEESFDFSQFILIGPDGTKYYLTRGEPDVVTWSAWKDRDPMGARIYPNPPQLTKVEFADGAVMERAFSGNHEIIKYYPTRAASGTLPTPVTVTVVRGTQGVLAGKIVEIRSSQAPADAPAQFSTDTPLVKYEYYSGGPSDKNLWRVSRLSNAGTMTYDVTEYQYDSSPLSTHLIIKVINPMRLVSFRAEWEAGKLKKTFDAADIERSVTYGQQLVGNVTYDISTVTTPYGNMAIGQSGADTRKITTVSKSNPYGNVVQTAIIALPPQGNEAGPSADVVSYQEYDEIRLKSSTDAAARVTSYFYNADGRLEQTRKPGGGTERVVYDPLLGMPSSVADARGAVSSSFYVDGKLTESLDARGGTTKTVYIESGELRGKVEYVEDALGNRTYSTYYKAGDGDRGDSPIGSVRETYLLEKPTSGDFNLTDTTLRRNWTKSIYFKNGLLKESTSTRIGRNLTGGNQSYIIRTAYEYDAQGRVTKTQQFPSDNPFTQTVNESLNPELHVTTQTYNKLGKVGKSTDKYGRTTRYYYDKRGNLVQTLYPDNTITRTVYDVNNRPIYQQAAHRPVESLPQPFGDGDAPPVAPTVTFGTRTVYDAFGRAVKSEKLSAVSVSLQQVQTDDTPSVPVAGMYNATFASVTADVLDSTVTDYDAIGRVLKVTDAAGSWRRFVYSDAVPTVSLSKKETFAGSGQGEVKIAEEEYDPNGNVLFSRTYDGGTPVSVSSFEYDELNRQTFHRIHSLDGLGAPVAVYSERKTDYDALGRRTQTTDGDGKVTDFAYDGAGRLRFVTEWLIEGATKTPVVTEYSYDEAGNLIVQKDALGRETKYEYDNFGRRIRRTLPGTQTETLAYDVFSLSQLLDGNNKLVQRDFRTDFKSQTTRRDYDTRGRLTWKGTGDGVTPLAQFTYTPWGARRTMIDPGGTSTYIYGRLTYNGSGGITGHTYDSDRLLLKHHSQMGAITYGYDSRGSMNRIDAQRSYAAPTLDAPSGTYRATYSSTSTAKSLLTYAYDPNARLQYVWRAGSLAAEYDYRDNGLLESVTYSGANNLRHSYTYAPQNALASLLVKQGATTIGSFDYNPTTRPLKQSGLRQAARDSLFNGAQTLTRTVDYTFDSLNRLTLENVAADAGAYTGTIDYGSIDKVGNRPKRQVTGATLAGKVLNVPSYAYDKNDWLDTDTNPNNANPNYDANGNTLFGDLDGNGSNEQTQADQYNLEDRLTQTVRGGTTITLTYDGDGHRVKKVAAATTTWYLVDDRNPTGYAQVLEERTTANGSPTALYAYGADLLCQTRGSTTHYYVYDALGSVRALVNTSGQFTDSYTYDAYGILIEKRTQSGANLVPTTGGTVNSYLFTGEQWDADLGMYYLRARYYAPGMGRFWNFDTFEGNQSDPLSLHKYLYAHANPVNRIDPSGNESLISLSIGSSISASLSGLYNGTDLIIQQSLQATIFGVQQGKNAQQILTGYYLDVAIGVGVGVVASKVIGLAGRAIYGAEVETFAGSASAASRTAARRANAILEGGEAAVEAAAANQLAGAGRGYGYLDKMLPGTLKEGSIIYSTVPPNRINGGLWATDGRAMVRAAGSSEAYRIGTQTVKPRDMVYAYRVKTKVPCAAGNAEWNYQNGEGGFPQFYIQQEDVGVLEKVAEFLLQ